MRETAYVLFLFILACKPNDKIEYPEVDETFEMIVPNNYITAGNDIAIQIINNDAYRGRAELILESAVSTQILSFDISSDYQDVDVDGSYVTDAGLCQVQLVVSNQIKDTRTFNVKAADVISPIELFTGPMTIWVNDLQETMVVALPKDKYANAARDGDSILFQSRHPDGKLSANQINVKNQLSYKKLNSASKSGKLFIGTSEEESGAKEQRVDVISMWPLQINIEVIDLIPYADNRQFCKLSTNVLKDVNDDIICDGTLVRYYLKNVDTGRSVHYNSYSIDGVSSVYIRNPSYASRWSAIAIIGNEVVKSNELILDFESNVKNIPIEIKSDELIVGPVASNIGQFVPDGTLVSFINDGKIIKKEAENGIVRFKKPDFFSDPMIIIGGIKKVINYAEDR